MNAQDQIPLGFRFGTFEVRRWYRRNADNSWSETVLMLNADDFSKVVTVDADARLWQIHKAVRFEPGTGSEVAVLEQRMIFERTAERMPDGMVIYREI